MNYSSLPDSIFTACYRTQQREIKVEYLQNFLYFSVNNS